MKHFIRQYKTVVVVLAVILVVAILLLLLLGGGSKADSRPRILVTNYPLYVAAQNILGDTDGVQLTMLSGGGAGCLHDYQLTPADRRALERADAVIINGVGAEPFLDGLVPEGRIVDTATGMILLESIHHEEHEQNHTATCYNEHVWVSAKRHLIQTIGILKALNDIDPANYQTYAKNAEAYADRILDVEREFPTPLERPCVLFHDSLSYLADDLGLDVKLTLSAEGESGISANHLAQVEALAKKHPDLLILYDTQYPIRYAAIDGLVPAEQVIALETMVVGEGNPNDWLDAMSRNAAKLQAVTKEGDTP